ncbi:MAG TPA: serine/threonine-protein kinase, partial [Polyangiales bacterium]|nr:serine/threonine-protein kinase [Polyangiales bacterium]
MIVCQHWRLRRALAGADGSQPAWEAEDVRSGARVAITFRARNARLQRARIGIRSPHVVQILDCGVTDDGAPFTVTELLEDGESLDLVLSRRERLGLSEAGAILDQILCGLARLHSLGFVHRDVCPANVFLVDATRVKLVDGEGAELERVPAARAAYWSPEQLASGDRVDRRADVWATGVLAYRMLTGRLPFACDDWPTLRASVQCGEFALASSVCPELPVALDAWFRDVLQVQPMARYAGAEPARAALAEIWRAAQPRPRAVPPPLPRGRAITH